LGEIPGAYERAFFGNSMEEDGEVYSDDEDGDPPEEGEVVIKFSKELKQRIRAPWNTSLIVKVFGRSVGYMFLVNKLKNLWRMAGNFSCVDLGLGFFLVRFDSCDGFEHVLKAGPWFVGDYFLSLRPWVPDFRASEAAVSSVAIWVRLPELPIEYYQKDSLMHIGKGLGPVLRVDYNTAAGTRGRFARICVQLDVDKPLARTIRVGKAKLAVVYEGIGQLCFHCGRIGHRLDWCPSRSLAVPATNSPNSQAEVDIPNAEETKGFGPWMIVQRRKRQAKRAVDSGKAVLVTAKVGGDDPGTSKAHAGKEVHMARGDIPKSTPKTLSAMKNKKAHHTEINMYAPSGPSGPSSSVVNPLEGQTSLQSQLQTQSPQFNTKPNTQILQTPPSTAAGSHQPISALISLRPQAPSRHDKHKMGSHPNAIGTFEVEDSGEEQDNHPLRGRYRADTERSPPRMGLVRDRACPSLEKHLPSGSNQRLSRSPSPNRFGMAPGSKPILEFPNRHAEDRRGTLSIEDSLSAIAGAEINSISRGGVLCNVARIRREEGDPIRTHSTPLEREPCVNQACSSGQMHSSLCDSDSMLREVKRGVPVVQVLNGSKTEHLWEMWPEKAWNALEAGGSVSNQQSSIYVEQ
jgi:hypothetical protein